MRHPYTARSGMIEPFLAMEILERALELEAEGRSILHFEIGEPNFPAPNSAVSAVEGALAAGETRYTDSRGLHELRTLIAEDKSRRCGQHVDSSRVIVTSGTSPAMLLVFSLLVLCLLFLLFLLFLCLLCILFSVLLHNPQLLSYFFLLLI